jgi:hypothetical protein
LFPPFSIIISYSFEEKQREVLSLLEELTRTREKVSKIELDKTMIVTRMKNSENEKE